MTRVGELRSPCAWPAGGGRLGWWVGVVPDTHLLVLRQRHPRLSSPVRHLLSRGRLLVLFGTRVRGRSLPSSSLPGSACLSAISAAPRASLHLLRPPKCLCPTPSSLLPSADPLLSSRASLNKLAIRGIRSFDDKHVQVIEFYAPLTVIVGHNGSGKTVRPREVQPCIQLTPPPDHHRMPEICHHRRLTPEHQGRRLRPRPQGAPLRPRLT